MLLRRVSEKAGLQALLQSSEMILKEHKKIVRGLCVHRRWRPRWKLSWYAVAISICQIQIHEAETYSNYEKCQRRERTDPRGCQTLKSLLVSDVNDRNGFYGGKNTSLLLS